MPFARFACIQCHQGQFLHVDIQFVDINVKGFDLLSFWDGALGANADCFPPEAHGDVLNAI